MRPLTTLVFLLLILPAACAAETLDALLKAGCEAEWRGDYAAAHERYLKATHDHPDSATAWAALGEHLRFYAHDAAGADKAFNTALKAKQRDSQAEAFAWRGLAELAASAGRDADAVSYFDKSLQAEPVCDTYRSLCHFYVQQKNWKAAAQSARRAVALAPDDPIALLLYAAQLKRAGNATEGRKQQALAFKHAGLAANGKASGPVHCCVYYNAAGYFAVCGDQPRALQFLAAFFATPNHRHLSRAQIVEDPDFAALKSAPEFTQLLDKHVPKN